MDSTNFTYWLQGFFEISDSNKLNEKQVQIIKDHLALVFDKVTPDRNGSTISDLEVGENVVPSGLFPKKDKNKATSTGENNINPWAEINKVICSDSTPFKPQKTTVYC